MFILSSRIYVDGINQTDYLHMAPKMLLKHSDWEKSST